MKDNTQAIGSNAIASKKKSLNKIKDKIEANRIS